MRNNERDTQASHIRQPSNRVEFPETRLVCKVNHKLFHIHAKQTKQKGPKAWRAYPWKEALSAIFRKRVLVGGLAAVLLFTVSVSFCLTNFALAYEVVMDGKTVCVVAAKEAFIETYQNVNQELSQLEQVQAEPLPEPEFVLTIVPNAAKATDEEIKQNILSTVDTVVSSYAIVVDSKPVVGMPTQEMCEQAIAALKETYDIAEEAVVEPMDSMEITEAAVPVAIYVESTEAALGFLTADEEQEVKYQVQDGDVFSVIAENHNMSVQALAALNPDIDVENINIGMQLTIKSSEPVIQFKELREEKKEAVIPYEIETTEDKNLEKGKKQTVREGVNGKKIETLAVSYINGKRADEKIVAEETLSQPVNQVIKIGTKEVPKATAKPQTTGRFSMPVSGTFTSGFGQRWGRKHTGVDFAAPTGTPIKAADGGKVILAGWNAGYGNCVIIDHGNGFTTYYAHMSAISVSVGQKVHQGQQVGKVGNTGNSTGPHLHFEVRKNNTPQNPMSYL